MSTLEQLKKLSLAQRPYIIIDTPVGASNLINEIEVAKLEAFNLGKKCGAESAQPTPESSLRKLQTTLPWTIKYSQDYRSNPQPHKDFTHALVHTAKALGKLMGLADDMNHDRTTALQSGLAAAYSKYIADLVVCALRAANTFPGGKVDLQREVEHRIESKNEHPEAPKFVSAADRKKFVAMDNQGRFLGMIWAQDLGKAIDKASLLWDNVTVIKEAGKWA